MAPPLYRQDTATSGLAVDLLALVLCDALRRPAGVGEVKLQPRLTRMLHVDAQLAQRVPRVELKQHALEAMLAPRQAAPRRELPPPIPARQLRR
jgi:hypothetical protein